MTDFNQTNDKIAMNAYFFKMLHIESNESLKERFDTLDDCYLCLYLFQFLGAIKRLFVPRT